MTQPRRSDEAAITVRDPVCGMNVDPAATEHHFDHGDETYHFCSATCRSKFASDPEGYLNGTAKPASEAAPGAADAEYTCPMHNETFRRSESPG